MESLRIVFPERNVVQVEHEEVPEEPGPRQVLLECEKTLMSTGTELTCLTGNFEPGTNWAGWVKYPFRPGYSWAGRVRAVGSETDSFRAGDRVAFRHPHAQFVLADAESIEDSAARIPEGVSFEEAAWLGLAKIVQVGIRRAEIELGSSVVIIGLGVLGQLAVQYARLCGARDVVAIDTAQLRIETALRFGATHAITSPAAEAAEELNRITDGRGADVVMDVSGAAQVFAEALGLCRKFGRLVVLGDTGTPSHQHLTHDLMGKGLTVVAAHDCHPPARGDEHTRWGSAEMQELFFDFLRQGRINVAGLITHRYNAADAPKAYDMLKTDRAQALGVILDFAEP